MSTPRISQIAAIGRNRGLGKDNDLIYRIDEDMRRFRSLTKGHVIVMGRKTFDSIPGAPLPNRVNIVVTRQKDWSREGVIVVPSIEEALEKAREAEQEEVFVIGGGEIYAQALPFTDRLYLTIVDDERPADAFFPEYGAFARVIEDEPHEENGTKYRFVTLEK